MATNPLFASDLEPLPPEEYFDADFFRLASECSVEAWLAFLGHRWNALLLYHLGQGPKRFGELAACLPTATPKMLTERIVALNRYALIRRPSDMRGEPYELTAKGAELLQILNTLELWSRDFPKIELPR